MNLTMIAADMMLRRAGGAPALPSGAIGNWFAFSATPRPHMLNEQSAGPVSANLFTAPRRLFNNTQLWQKTGATIVDEAATAPDGSNDASTLTAAGNWFLSTRAFSNIPAGTYTLAVSAKRNTGSDQQFAFSGDNTATRSPAKTATSTWQRFSYTFTKGSPTSPAAFLLCSVDGSTGANIQICDFELFAGSSDLGPSVPSGHLYLGTNAFDSRPAYASGAVDLSGGSWGLVQFASNFSTAACTTLAVISKTAAGSGYHAWLSKVQNYLDFTAYSEINLAPYRGIGNTVVLDAAGLWSLLNRGYHVLTHRYDGTKSQLWLDDILLFEATGGGTKDVRDLFSGIVSSTDLPAGFKLAQMALYDRALTAAEIRTAASAVKARAAGDGVTLTFADRIFVAEGDSISAVDGAWPYLYGPNASPAVLGNNIAVSGSTIADLEARAAQVDAMLPPNRTGRKFILTVLIGRNDLAALGVTAWLAALSSYLDARRAAGWIVVLGTVLPATASGFNALRNTANTTLRTWTGVHCDALIDFAANATMGPDAAASNATLYSDGTHPTSTGQANLEAIARPVLNAL
jgi:lysophospholipase L1-like esterase